MSMYEVIGNKAFTTLLADPQGADKIAIPCEPGKGQLTAGCLMARGAAGLWAPATAVADTGLYAVLAEDVDTTGLAGEGVTIAEDAAAFRAGCFVRGAVKLGSGAAVSAADEVKLAKLGIVFDVKVSTAAPFDNSVQA